MENTVFEDIKLYTYATMLLTAGIAGEILGLIIALHLENKL